MSYQLPSSIYITKRDPKFGPRIVQTFYKFVYSPTLELDQVEFNRRFKLWALTEQTLSSMAKASVERATRASEFYKPFLELLEPPKDPWVPCLSGFTKSEIEKLENLSKWVNSSMIPHILVLCKLEKNRTGQDISLPEIIKTRLRRLPTPVNYPVQMLDSLDPYCIHRKFSEPYFDRIHRAQDAKDWWYSCRLEDENLGYREKPDEIFEEDEDENLYDLDTWDPKDPVSVGIAFDFGDLLD